jgi:hypothetical protein
VPFCDDELERLVFDAAFFCELNERIELLAGAAECFALE